MAFRVPVLACIASVLFCGCSIGEDEGNSLEIVRVTPSGVEVPISRGEVIVEFNKQMVAFGQTDKDLDSVPVEIKPALECTWRWTSSTQLTCTHSDFLTYTTSYSITVGTTIEALDGSRLASQREFTFQTASLRVYGRNSLWRHATRPIIEVTFSQPMALETILEKVHIRDEQASELKEIKVVHVTDMPRYRRYSPTFYVQDEGGLWVRANDSEEEELLQYLDGRGIDRKKYAADKRNFASRTWFLESLLSLVPDTTYDLEVAPNVKSISATESTTRSMHIAQFEVYPAFTLLGLECQDTNGAFRQHLINASGSSQGRLSNCDPDEGITLLLSAPVGQRGVNYSSLISPRHETGRSYADSRVYAYRSGSLAYISQYDIPGESTNYATDDDLNKVNIGYKLHGNTTYELRVGYGDLTDIFGRRLRPPTDVKFRTGHLKPRLLFEPSRIVSSAKSDLSLPIDVANLNGLNVRLATKVGLQQDWSVSSEMQQIDLADDQIVSTTIDFENWLTKDALHFVAEIEPITESKYGENPETSCIYGQITPYDIQARVGLTSSIAWVTDLDTGKVVENASVSLVETKEGVGSVLLETFTNEKGIASLPGRASFIPSTREKELPVTPRALKDTDCQTPFQSEHSLWVDGPKGRAILPLSGHFSTGGHYSHNRQDPHLSVWGHTAQGLYRPGQEVEYKIYVREQSDKGLRIGKDRRFRLVVTEGYGEVIYHERDIALSEFGSFHGNLKVPESTLGSDETLIFRVMIDDGEELSSILDEEGDSLDYSKVEYWKALEVDVLDFDPASIRVESSLDKSEYDLGDELLVKGRADLLSGGPFSNAPIELRAFLMPESFESEHPESKDFTFVAAIEKFHHWRLEDFHASNTSTDKEGGFSASLELNDLGVYFGTLTVSIGVQEDSGNIIWENERTKYRGAYRFVGVRHIGERPRVGEVVSVDSIVVDPLGVPRNDRPVSLKYFRIDAPYSWDSTKDVLIHSCELSENQTPKSCEWIPRQAGDYRAVAAITTADGRVQEAKLVIYVQGRVSNDEEKQRDFVHIANRNELQDRLFRSGELASLVVEHSVPGSSALVTVERLGILDQWVTELEGSHDVIDIPIRDVYAPIVRATVTVTTTNSSTKPRTFLASDEQEKFPNSWVRSVELRVKDPTRVLDVQINTDREIYEPGEKVKVSVAVNGQSSSGKSPMSELAIAVVDQGVLEVSEQGIGHFDPVQGILESMNIDIVRYWLLSEGNRSIGRRGFDFSTIGDQTPRSDEDLTSFWMPNLETDSDGTARFEFEIGDRLTEWKIIVVAATPTEHFGIGTTSVSTNLGVEIRPVLPNQVTDGDVFDASFSVLNRTESKRDVFVEIEAKGEVEPYSHSESITLEPYERKLVTARTQASLAQDQDPSGGSIQLLAIASSGEDTDALLQEVPVLPSKRFFISSIYGTSTDSTISEPIEIPIDVTDGTGSLKVQVTPSLISTIEERVAKVRDYPYQCWEQKLSSAVVAAQFSQLRERINVEWEDANEYIEDVLQSAVDYQSSRSGGFGYWNRESSHTDLYLSGYTALAFRWLLDAGYKVPEEVLGKLLGYLEEYTVYRLPDYLSVNNTSIPSLRLMLANALVQHGRGDLHLITELYQENLKPNLFAISQTLEAAIALDAPNEQIEPLASRLTNSVGVSGDRALIHHGTVMGRNYMLSSTLKTTCSAISAFVRANEQGREMISEERLAELVRGVLFEWNHQEFGANPHESSFCLSALVEYAESKETVSDSFRVDVELVLEGLVNQPEFEESTEMNASERSFVFATSLKPEFVGLPGDLKMKQGGDSRFYYKATLQYEPTEMQLEPENFGIDISKTYWVKNEEDKWVELNESHELRRGDVVQVGLYLDIRDQRDFVIVDDPVPGFLQPINLRLAKTNAFEVQPAVTEDYTELTPEGVTGRWQTLGSSRFGFYNREIGNDSVRFASDFLQSGRYRLHWAGRVISTGEFSARPAHAEAMYSPEIYGNSATKMLQVAGD